MALLFLCCAEAQSPIPRPPEFSFTGYPATAAFRCKMECDVYLAVADPTRTRRAMGRLNSTPQTRVKLLQRQRECENDLEYRNKIHACVPERTPPWSLTETALGPFVLLTFYIRITSIDVARTPRPLAFAISVRVCV